MTPVALVAYQSGLTVLVTAQEPPEDVTGAAGVLDGDCAGGASECAGVELASLGCLAAGLVAGVLAGLVAGVPPWPAAGLAVLAWPGMACAKAAANPAVAATAAAATANDSDLMRLTSRRR